MSLRLTVKIEKPRDADERGYERYDDLAEMIVDIGDELAWSLYRHCVTEVSTPTVKVGKS